jgi:ABC-type antimicrobial peptide transport system permease subunit
MLIAQTSDDEENARGAIDRRLSRGDSSSIKEIHTIASALAVQLYPFDFAYWTAALVGGVALLLTITGVYGVLTYVVAQRQREFGVRLALGAQPSALIAYVIGQLVRLAVVGVAIGLACAIAAAWVLRAISFFVNLRDPMGYVLGAGVVLASCLVAAYVPARRAAAVNPVEALRADS